MLDKVPLRIVDRVFDLVSDRTGKVKPFQVQQDCARIQHVCEEIVKSPVGIDAFSLFANHNGKKSTDPKEFNYYSGLIVEANWMVRLRLIDYQNIEMDHERYDLMRRIQHDGVWHVETNKLLPGKLRDELLHMNLAIASFFHVMSSKYANWYILARTHIVDPHFLKPAEQHHIRLAVNQVRDSMRNYKK